MTSAEDESSFMVTDVVCVRLETMTSTMMSTICKPVILSNTFNVFPYAGLIVDPITVCCLKNIELDFQGETNLRIEVRLGMHQTGPITGEILLMCGLSDDDDDHIDRMSLKKDIVTWEAPGQLAGINLMSKSEMDYWLKKLPDKCFPVYVRVELTDPVDFTHKLSVVNSLTTGLDKDMKIVYESYVVDCHMIVLAHYSKLIAHELDDRLSELAQTGKYSLELPGVWMCECCNVLQLFVDCMYGEWCAATMDIKLPRIAILAVKFESTHVLEMTKNAMMRYSSTCNCIFPSSLLSVDEVCGRIWEVIWCAAVTNETQITLDCMDQVMRCHLSEMFEYLDKGGVPSAVYIPFFSEAVLLAHNKYKDNKCAGLIAEQIGLVTAYLKRKHMEESEEIVKQESSVTITSSETGVQVTKSKNAKKRAKKAAKKAAAKLSAEKNADTGDAAQ